jgi:predicted GNAT family N-acyltransferase
MPSKTEVRKVVEQADLDKASAIRYEVFVIGQDCPPGLEVEFDDESTHFLATVNGEPAGACRFRKTGKGYKLERFAVLEKFRGQGIGQALVSTALEALPAEADYIYLHSQVRAVSLYTRFGFEQSGPEFEEAGMMHYKMVKR